jgi:nitroreductase
MDPLLPLTLDELLTTMRAVILECLAIAQQALTASNMQNWHFVVVTYPGKRAVLADIYRQGWERYVTMCAPPALPAAHRRRLASDATWISS